MPPAPRPDPVVSVEALTAIFGETVAVDGLTFQVGRGEIFALLGPDGAGKTTTLRMLCGALAPTSGTIMIDGIDVVREPARVYARLGYMPQRFSLYTDLTVRENLDFYAEMFEVPHAAVRDRRRRLLQFSGLTAFEDRLAEQLSGGMKQKLALACTLIHEPALLFLDEPTAGVDPVSRREFWRILYEINRGGVTIVISTTYMDEADRCTTVGMLYAGSLVATEDPLTIKRRMRGDVVEFVAEPKEVARHAVKGWAEVLSETVIRDRLHIVVPDAAAAMPVLTQRLAAQGVRVRDVTTVPPSLEDVFVSMIAERRGRQGGAAFTAGVDSPGEETRGG